MIVKNDLYDYPHRYIYQDTDGFKFSIDSLLLAEFVKLPKKDGIILDMCTGNAPIPLVLSTKTKNKIYMGTIIAGKSSTNNFSGIYKRNIV